ncbi:elicitor-responsive protein 3-like isoform X1 [Typha angustifolia]|uniref:elicitor-responsive protein 3-like isoform X1 n=1 Tax=Typha angustifolia TaxID=59011 RepID=UPI003C2E01F9
MAAVNYGIQNQTLEATVLGCNMLRNTEYFTTQDPYVIVDYGGTQYRTRTCSAGGRNPSFNDRFLIRLIEGLLEMNIYVWNSNTWMSDTFIGSGRVQLETVIVDGYSDNPCMLQTTSGRYAGQVNLILRYSRRSNVIQQAYPPEPHQPPHMRGQPYNPHGPYPGYRP